jgi:hypothetical protein
MQIDFSSWNYRQQRAGAYLAFCINGERAPSRAAANAFVHRFGAPSRQFQREARALPISALAVALKKCVTAADKSLH